jgi:hypothetical protein
MCAFSEHSQARHFNARRVVPQGVNRRAIESFFGVGDDWPGRRNRVPTFGSAEVQQIFSLLLAEQLFQLLVELATSGGDGDDLPFLVN